MDQCNVELKESNEELFREIDLRKHTEKALLQSESDLHHIYDNSPVMMHSIDENARFCDVNKEWLRVTGYSREEVIGQRLDFLMTPESTERALSQVLPRFWREGFVRNVSYCYIKKDGTLMDVLLDCNATTNPAGKKISLSVVRDVTKQKRSQEEIWGTKAVLRAVVDGISEPIIFLDQDLRVKILNEAALKYYSLSSYQEIIGKPCHEALKIDASVCQKCIIPPAVKKHERLRFERKGVFNPRRYELVFVYPVKKIIDGQSGAIIRICDITEKKKIDEQLIRADRLSSLGLLSCGIAHEIRNPLSGINLFLDILYDQEKFERTDQEIEILKEIKTNIEKINGIIKRVLEFASHSDLNLKPVDINSLILDTLKFWGSKMGSKEIALKLSLDKDLPRVHADLIELQQVVNNLIQNSFDAMPNGGKLNIRTTTCTSAFQKDRQVVKIGIEDTGQGIKPDHHEKIFNPFFTTKSNGTGLGLSISSQIIDRHGGVISFESVEGAGTRFHLELPIMPGS